jgi:outer membrane protein assembly factor BamD (BamD/ComL family)
MIRNTVMTGVVLGLILLGIQWLLQGSNLKAYGKRLPGSNTAPMLEYYAGHGYLIASDYDTAGAYFKDIFTQYPTSSYAEAAHAYWLECLTMELYKSPARAVAECKAFLQQYPESTYAPLVRQFQRRCEAGMLH